ncbi:MAG: lysophospholipid acyltransferase family protein [Prevotella sp.]|nr:lysophospholipid acyltransferase family protein [Prevotella sp.]
MKNILFHLLYALWRLLALLPLRVHYLLSDVLFVFIFYILHYRRRTTWVNLVTSFPEKSQEELLQIERRFYHWFCDYLAETVKLVDMSPEQLRRRMVFKGTDVVDQCVRDGQSCAVYLGHYCNWEWITSLPLWVCPEAQCGQIYHPLESAVFDRLFLHVRQRFGAVCIATADILRRTVEFKRQGRATVIGYIADQVPHWNNIHHWCQFLNHDTPVMTGTERIARKQQQALFYLDVERKSRGYYEATFRLITRKADELAEFEATDTYYQLLEESIRRQPELWLWTHNRWKRTRQKFDLHYMMVDGKVIPKPKTEETT